MKDRKLVAVGLTNLLTRSSKMVQPPHVTAWPGTLTALLEMLNLPDTLASSTAALTNSNGAADDNVDVPDDEEMLGYQASFSRLGASERARPDPVAHVTVDAKTYLAQNLARLASSSSSGSSSSNINVGQLMGACPQDVVGPFLEFAQGQGLVLR